MKDILINFLLFVITIVLIAGLALFGFIIYKTMFDEDKTAIIQANDTLVGVDVSAEYVERIEKKSIGDTITEMFVTKEPETVTYSSAKSQTNYFYNQLNLLFLDY